MRLLLTAAAVLLLGSPVNAQLAPPNAAGVTYGHVHLNVSDIEVHKALWVEHFGGVVVQKGQLTAVRLPGTMMVFTERAPTGGSEGSVMDHVGFKVPDLEAFLAGWRDAGYEVTSEFTGSEGAPNAYVLSPDGVKIELQEEPTLSVKAEAYHVHFFTSGYRELLDWYVDLFTMEPRARGAIPTTADVPGMNISFSNSRSERVATRGRAIDHIGFEIEGLKAFCEMLEARGIVFDVPYREIASIELAIAFFTDASGVFVELTEGFDKW